MDKLNKYRPLVLGIFAVLAPIIAYLFQVDPLSLCKPTALGAVQSTGALLPSLANPGGGQLETQLDAGVDVK